MNGNEPPNRRRHGSQPPAPPDGRHPPGGHRAPQGPPGPTEPAQQRAAGQGFPKQPPGRAAQHRRPPDPPAAAPIPRQGPPGRQPAPPQAAPHQPVPPLRGAPPVRPEYATTMHAPVVGQGGQTPALAYSRTPGGDAPAGGTPHPGNHPGGPDHGQRPGPIGAEPVRVPPQRHPYQSAPPLGAPPLGAPPHGEPPHGEPPSPPRRSRNPFRQVPGRRLRLGRIALIVVIALLLSTVAAVFYYDGRLRRVDALSSYAGRPGPTPGNTWLIVGTDSREGLSQADKDRLATGDSDGARTDTIMLVHKPPSGKSMIISIPRDLYVEVPGNGQRKINAAFNFGGPKLLVQTVEQLTKLRIDHYGEIGFGGFADLVDAVGGVNICIDKNLRDPKAGLRLKKGCHDLNGKQALGLVRTRAFPNADLERVVNQRKFLSALMAKSTSPGVVLNPFRLIPFVNGAVGSLTVDKKDHLWNLVGLAMAMRSSPITTTTPNAGAQVTDEGDSLIVGSNTEEFFTYLREGKPVPDELIENSGGAIQ